MITMPLPEQSGYPTAPYEEKRLLLLLLSLADSNRLLRKERYGLRGERFPVIKRLPSFVKSRIWKFYGYPL